MFVSHFTERNKVFYVGSIAFTVIITKIIVTRILIKALKVVIWTHSTSLRMLLKKATDKEHI